MNSTVRRQTTPTLIFSVLAFLQGAVLFGLDTGSFGSLQALPSFVNDFGVAGSDGEYTLPATRRAMLNSLPWLGKIIGCFGAEVIIGHFGFKKTMYLTALIQIVAVVIELTSHAWAQFTVGRIIAYSAVGIVENVVPGYGAEVSPAATRGLFAGSIMFITGMGNLWGAGMSRAFATETHSKGWIIPTAMQFVPALMMLLLVPFTPESPRWLILKGQMQKAKTSLDRLRPKHDVDNGTTQAEVDALEFSIEESKARNQGSWMDLFRGNYLRRTWICATLFIVGQTNGNQFVQSYAATFYVQRSLGANSFTYSVLGQLVGIIGCGIGLVLFDISGRRPLMIWGSAACTFLLYLAAGLGNISMENLNQHASNMILACFIMLPAFTRISASNNAFLTGAEIGGVSMRKKTMAFGTACDVAAAFLVTFVTPYLLPSMGVNIGWIFGSVACFSTVWAYLFFPELKARSLEEVDELFEAKLPARHFGKYETCGTGRHIASLENNGRDDKNKVGDESVEVA